MTFGVLLLFGLVFLGGIIGLVILLTSPAMRGVAAVLLSIGGLLVVLVLLAGMFSLRVATDRDLRREEVHREDLRREQDRMLLRPAHTEVRETAAEVGPTPDSEAAPRAPATVADSSAEPDAPAPVPGEPPPWLEGKRTWTRDGVYWARVRVGPYPRDDTAPDRPLPRPVNVSELRQMLRSDPLLAEMFRAAVDQAVAQYTGRLDPEQQVPLELPDSFVLERLVAEAWQSPAPTPEAIPLEPASQYSDMIDLHLLLKFDSAVRSDISALRREAIIQARIGALGAILLIVLLVLGTVLLYLRARRPASPPTGR